MRIARVLTLFSSVAALRLYLWKTLLHLIDYVISILWLVVVGIPPNQNPFCGMVYVDSSSPGRLSSPRGSIMNLAGTRNDLPA